MELSDSENPISSIMSVTMKLARRKQWLFGMKFTTKTSGMLLKRSTSVNKALIATLQKATT